MNYKFKISCIDSKPELIEQMVENAREIKYDSLKKFVPVAELMKLFPDYLWGKGNVSQSTLKLRNDRHVKFFGSNYDGQKCFYIVHSAIEYVFTEEPDVQTD
jgi:hypothetical protein